MAHRHFHSSPNQVPSQYQQYQPSTAPYHQQPQQQPPPPAYHAPQDSLSQWNQTPPLYPNQPQTPKSLPTPFHLTKNQITTPQTGIKLFTITRSSLNARNPSFLSSKPLLTLTHTPTGTPIGSIRFHTLTTSNIHLSLHGFETVLEEQGLIHGRWAFAPVFNFPGGRGKLYVTKDVEGGGAVLVDAKKGGRVLARLEGGLLRFERLGLTGAQVEEVVLVAVAVVEAVRREGRATALGEVMGGIGELAGALGDGGGGGDGGGS